MSARSRIAGLLAVAVLLLVVGSVSRPLAEPITGNVGGTATMIQGHGCDPGKVLRKKPANTVYKKGSGGDVDITGWTSMEVYPTSDGNIIFNNITSAYVFSGQRNTLILHKDISTIKIDVEHRGCGM